MIHNNLPKSPNGPIPCPPEQKYNTQNKQQTKNQEYSVIPHQINMPPCCYYGKHKWMTWNGSFNTLYSQTRDWVAACMKQTITQAAVLCVISACLTLSGWEYTRIRYYISGGSRPYRVTLKSHTEKQNSHTPQQFRLCPATDCTSQTPAVTSSSGRPRREWAQYWRANVIFKGQSCAKSLK